jgi:lysyl-tRNA synthetase class 2
MALTEKIAEGVALKLHGTSDVAFAEHTLSFKGPFTRLPMPEAVKDATGLDFLAMDGAAQARAAMKAKFPDLELAGDASWGECLEEAFAEAVEPTLIQPTHITHFPKDISPLAKSDPSDPRLVERFETFCNGWEIANAFSELNDPVEQRARMVEQRDQAHARGETSRELDEDFLAAIEQGMPPTGGLGIGIDRLIMLMTDTHTIRDVILYPALRAREG